MKRVLYFLIPVFYVLHVLSLMISMAGMEFFGWGGFILVLIAEAHERVVNKKTLFVSHPFNKYVIIFGLALTISVILSPYLAEVQRPWHFYVGRLRYLLLFFFNTTVLTYFVDIKKLLKWLPAFILPVLLLYMFQSLSGVRVFGGGPETKIFNWSWDFSRGISGHFVHYIEFAAIFEMFTFLLLPFVFFNEYKYKNKVFLATALLVSIFSLAVSGTRAFFIVFPSVILIQALLNSSRKAFIGILLLVVISPVVAYNLSPHLRRKVAFTKTYIDRFGDPYRYNLWRAHLLMFKDNPVKGIGFYVPIENKFIEPYYKKLATRRSETYRGTTLAHNSYIDMLSGSGLIGFFAFLTMSVMLFVYLFKTRSMAIKAKDNFSETLCLGLIGALCSLYINMLVDSVFLYIKVSYVFVFIAGMIIYLNNRLRKPSPR